MTQATDAAYRALAEALDETRPECRDDLRFILDDYRAAELKHLCDRCALFDLCEKYAQLGLHLCPNHPAHFRPCPKGCDD